MCIEQWWLLLHERFVSDVHRLLSQTHPVTVRWIASLMSVGSVSWTVDREMINVIESQLLDALCVGNQGLRAVQFAVTTSLSRDCVL